MDSFAWVSCIHWCCCLLFNTTIHWSTTTGENCIRCLFPRCNYLSRMLICISYTVLSFGNRWKTIFKVIICPHTPCVIWFVISFYVIDFPHLIRHTHTQTHTTFNYFIFMSLSNFDFYLFFFFWLIRLDYCGIALLIMGSFVPWVYYGFYCHYEHKLVYLSVVMVLGFFAIIVSLYDKFSEPQLRPLRAGKWCHNHISFYCFIRFWFFGVI